MKKFVFTLEKVRDLKLDEQKVIKLALENVDKRIRQVSVALENLEADIQRERDNYGEVCKTGTNAATLSSFSIYFKNSREKKAALNEQLRLLNIQRSKRVEQLVKNLNEVKVLDEKYDAQLKEYQAQARSEQEKEVENFVSFNSASGK